MSKLSKKDLHTPFTSKTISKLIGFFLRGQSEQATAATLASSAMVGLTPATQNGKITSLYLVSADNAASGESMVFDVLKNGVSILTATYTFNSSSTKDAQIELPLAAASANVAVGDRLTVARTYTAGGSPTMMATSVVIEYSPNDSE
jgi:hypothetical protein